MTEPRIMTDADLQALQPGDIIGHRSGRDSYIVTANYGTRVTAVRTVDVTNPGEWLIIRKTAEISNLEPLTRHRLR